MAQAEAAQPTPILVERRFPLDLAHTIASIRDLYDSGKQARWDPTSDIPWGRVDPSAYDAATIEAARLSWSRRAWTEWTGLPETPALLIRFCLEVGREADPKYYLSVRNTEEAWHVECCHRFAKALGGYVETPVNTAYAELFNRNFHKCALDADRSLDAYIAAHCALEDGIDLELWRGYLGNATDPVAKQILALCVEDKKRHAAFGWFYLEKRAPELSAADKALIAGEVADHLRDVVFHGYHCAWLVPGGAGKEVVDADRATAAAGLGALDPEAERKILTVYLDIAYGKFAALGIAVDRLDIPAATS